MVISCCFTLAPPECAAVTVRAVLHTLDWEIFLFKKKYLYSKSFNNFVKKVTPKRLAC